MRSYLGKRVITGILCIFAALCINFILIHAAPGNPARLLIGSEHPDPVLVANMTEKFGLDKPLIIQFQKYVFQLLKGDLGVSYYTNEPVAKLIGERFAATALLVITSIVLAVGIGLFLGILSARKAGGKMDTFFGSFSYLFDAIPSFWLGLMAILLFASKLKLLPSSGMVNVREDYEGMAHVLDVLKHLILPAMTLTFGLFPYYYRITRSSMIQVLGEEFITTLRAAGMPEKKIFRKYVFRNAILPTVTSIGIQLAYLVTGAAIAEIVFSWPGMGSFIMTAISRRDYPVLMGIYLVLSISVVIMMLVVDILYSVLDPRVVHQNN